MPHLNGRFTAEEYIDQAEAAIERAEDQASRSYNGLAVVSAINGMTSAVLAFVQTVEALPERTAGR
jgi:hypothetical protein